MHPDLPWFRNEAKLCKSHCDQVNVSAIADWLLRIGCRCS